VDAYDMNLKEQWFLSPATGSRSILPPDNATGNFVKTIQRLPVKISIDPSNDVEKVKLLRP
jgi:membrane fusion protein (multidrug efflux system)